MHANHRLAEFIRENEPLPRLATSGPVLVEQDFPWAITGTPPLLFGRF